MDFKLKRRISTILLIGILAVITANLIGCPEEQQEPNLTVYFVDTGTEETLSIEEYIAGVVAAEMKEDWPVEAYAAQAIIARTFTMRFIEEGGSEYGTDISTDHEEAQAFDRDAVTDTIREAVENTRGEVILHDGKYIQAWFHAAAGGRTAFAREGLGIEDEEPPYITSVDSPDMDPEVEEEVRSWTASFSLSEVKGALAGLGIETAGEIEEIRAAEEGRSGRTVILEIVHEEGTDEVHANELRIALDAVELKSTLFTEPIQREDDEFIFTGRGYGHGVGMSQWGAYVMAKQGRSPEDIVLHYYKDVEIETRW